MEEQKLVQVSIQLPVSELGRLSALLERLQQVLTSSDTPPAGTVQPVEQDENTAFDPARFSALSKSSDLQEPSTQAASLLAEAEAGIPLPASAAREVERQLPEANGTQFPIGQETTGEGAQDLSPTSGLLADAPAVRAATEIGGKVPPSAGFSVEGSPDISNVRDAVLEERLISAGPAPLTAEAVSLAFRRDDRRYDNGFPLY